MDMCSHWLIPVHTASRFPPDDAETMDYIDAYMSDDVILVCICWSQSLRRVLAAETWTVALLKGISTTGKKINTTSCWWQLKLLENNL